MKTNVPSSVSPLSTVTHLLLAFLLGIPFGFADTFREPSISAPAIYGVWQVPLAVLIVSALLSIVLDPQVRQGRVRPGRVLVGIVGMLFFAVVVVTGQIALLKAGPGLYQIGLFMGPVLLALAVAFAVGGSGSWRLGLATGLVAWLGAGLHVVAIGLIDSVFYERRFHSTTYELTFTIAYVVACFPLTALGGVLGRGLRKGLLRE